MQVSGLMKVLLPLFWYPTFCLQLRSGLPSFQYPAQVQLITYEYDPFLAFPLSDAFHQSPCWTNQQMTEEQQRKKVNYLLQHFTTPLTNIGKVTCDTVWHWHKEVPPPAFQARGVEFSAVCWLRCPQLCHWKYSMSQGIQYWCSPVGNHHDDILTILASSWQLDHLVALALAGLLDVHLLNICQAITHHRTVINSLREKVTRVSWKKLLLWCSNQPIT